MLFTPTFITTKFSKVAKFVVSKLVYCVKVKRQIGYLPTGL